MPKNKMSCAKVGSGTNGGTDLGALALIGHMG